MENATTGETKLCPHCQKEISVKATRCPHCQADLRSFARRHPILTVIFGFIVIGIVFNAVSIAFGNNSQQYTTSDTSAGTGDAPVASGPTPDSLMAQNSPTIKELGTLPTNYIGQTFTLYVNAEDARYYNYAFDDESAWYSLQIWDDSVDGDYDGVYAYLPKTAANTALINKALNGTVFLKINASVPADKWQGNGDNAFVEINSWSEQ